MSPTGLGDDAPVIRGGHLKPEDLLNSAMTATVKLGRAGLSVAGGNVAHHRELLDEILHSHVSCTTAGALRAAGFEIEQTGSRQSHHVVWLLPDGVEDSAALVQALQRFAGVFDSPVPRGDVV